MKRKNLKCLKNQKLNLELGPKIKPDLRPWWLIALDGLVWTLLVVGFCWTFCFVGPDGPYMGGIYLMFACSVYLALRILSYDD